MNSKNKTVKAFVLPGNDHCVVRLLDKYLSLLPSYASYFYMQAKDKAPPDQSEFLCKATSRNQCTEKHITKVVRKM